MKSLENRNTYLLTALVTRHTHTFQRVEKVQLNTTFPQHPLVTMCTAVPDGNWSLSERSRKRPTMPLCGGTAQHPGRKSLGVGCHGGVGGGL
jgi:hypothetical protein